MYRTNFSSSILSVAFLMSLLIASSAKGQIPSSIRSKEAIERITPTLKEELEASGFELGSPLFIRIFKAESELELWIQQNSCFVLFKKYDICEYSGTLGPKTKQGDLQSPEGFYFINASGINPWSSFHLSMNLGYPNTYDRKKGYTGDYLMIHGECASIGCYAMTNPGIEEIFTVSVKALGNGQSFIRAHIFPFRMTTDNMGKHYGSEWYSFWENLKLGYDWFEENKIPPNVEVDNGHYVFN